MLFYVLCGLTECWCGIWLGPNYFIEKVLDTWHKVIDTHGKRIWWNCPQPNLIPQPGNPMPKPQEQQPQPVSPIGNPTMKSNPKSATSDPKPLGGWNLHGAKHVQWKWKMVFMLFGAVNLSKKT